MPTNCNCNDHLYQRLDSASRTLLTRRTFLKRSAAGLGLVALGSLFDERLFAAGALASPGGLPGLPHFPAKVKRIIYLFQSGAPSQMDLFDYKPNLVAKRGEELPDSIRMGQRITTMTSGQKSLPVAPSVFKFAQYGQSGAWVSELLPRTAELADELCLIKSMHTEAINHDPAITFLQTGAQIPGRPSIGSWLAYGLGSDNRDLPAYVVLTSIGTGRPVDQPLYDRLWGSGFLPTQYAGVRFRGSGDAVPFLTNPPGVSRDVRRTMIDDLDALNAMEHAEFGDPETSARIAQYELAFRMQASVPELTDIAKEPQNILDLYGPEVTKRGSYASNCLLARRLCERGVRFVQLFHRGWDHHENVVDQLPKQCRDTDQPTAALLRDLKQRGLLKDTLVIWGGEFGRTIYSQGELTEKKYGRDHHPRCFTIWLAGAGIKAGQTLGETDDYSYNIVRDPVDVHDLHATILSLLGIEHTKLIYRFQGRDFRLTDVHGNLVKAILA